VAGGPVVNHPARAYPGGWRAKLNEARRAERALAPLVLSLGDQSKAGEGLGCRSGLVSGASVVRISPIVWMTWKRETAESQHMVRGKALLFSLAALAVHSCAAHTSPVSIPSVQLEGCPVVLLTRTGGLGFESRSGVIAAVWKTGVIVRAKSAQRPWGSHELGRLNAAELAELIRTLNTGSTWDSQRGEVALDSPKDVLTLRREAEVRTWAESPGMTSTPTVAQFRSTLLGLPLESPRRTTDAFDDLWKCLH
jgi:hypothetical protein